MFLSSDKPKIYSMSHKTINYFRFSTWICFKYSKINSSKESEKRITVVWLHENTSWMIDSKFRKRATNADLCLFSFIQSGNICLHDCFKVWSSIHSNKRKLLLCHCITEDSPYRSHDHHIVSLFLILGTTSGCLEMRAKRSVVPHLSIPMTWKYGRHFNFPLTDVQQGFLCDELKVNGAWKKLC